MTRRSTLFLFAVSLISAGCLFIGRTYVHRDTKHKMTQRQIEYHKQVVSQIEAKSAQLKKQGNTKAEILKWECESYDEFIAGAPEPQTRKFVAAKNLLERDKNYKCQLAAKEARKETHRAVNAAYEKRRAAAIKARQEARLLEQQRSEAEREQRLKYKAQLQKKIWKVGKIRCQVIDFQSLGESFGVEYATVTASGIFVAVLAKCTNVSKRTRRVHSTDFNLVDSAGRVYAVDTKGSYYFAIANQSEHHKNPEFLQLHPNVDTYIGCVFDVPAGIIEDQELVLDFRGARFQLLF